MLKKIELHNFKSHRYTHFKFDSSRLQAIVGQNSSGKTSILQALYLLSQRLDNEPATVFSSQNIPYSIVTAGQNNMSVKGDGSWDDSSRKDWSFSFGFDRVITETHNYWRPKKVWT